MGDRRAFFLELAEVLERYDATIEACHGPELGVTVGAESIMLAWPVLGSASARDEAARAAR